MLARRGLTSLVALPLRSVVEGGRLRVRTPPRAARALDSLLSPSHRCRLLCTQGAGSGSGGDDDASGHGNGVAEAGHEVAKEAPRDVIGEGEGEAVVDEGTIEAQAEAPAEAAPAELVEAVAESDWSGGEEGLVKLDPENISTIPPVLVFPFPARPLFPGVYQPCEVTDTALAHALLATKASHHPYVGVFLPRPEYTEQSAVNDPSQVHKVGTLAHIVRLTQTPRGVQLMLLGGKRVLLERAVQKEPVMLAKVEEARDEVEDADAEGPPLAKAYSMEVMQTIKEILKLNPFFKEQMQMILERSEIHEAGKLADFGAALTTADAQSLQEVLGTLNVTTRIEKTLLLLKKELELSKLQSQISKQVEDKISANQRRYMLMEQLKQIKKELGLEKDDKEALIAKFSERIAELDVPAEAKRTIEEEMAKLQSLESTSSEFNVTRNYLDWLTALPWGVTSEENLDLARAEQVLEDDHYGLEDIKQRILEFIAVGALCGSTQGKIICFVGPPGVGKTSIGTSIAKALNREFYRFSVGGLSDVSEIKGHRRTYVGAMPGKLIQCLKSTGASNPVVLIDEVDKLGRGYQGDPASALLEALDPSQNGAFMDHYLDVPVDLSKVLFLCTANVSDTIPGPLLDRMEVVRLSGYILDEKVQIARRYLEPSARKQMGLREEHIELTEEAVVSLIRWYCRESGVRNLQKHIEKICRKVALKVVRSGQVQSGATTATDSDDSPVHGEAAVASVPPEPSAEPSAEPAGEEGVSEPATGQTALGSTALGTTALGTFVVGPEQLSEYVGKPIFTSERIYESNPPGVVTGLAWTSMGGAVLYIETQPIGVSTGADASESGAGGERGSGSGSGGGSVRSTGQMGDVMRESTQIAHTFSRSYLHQLQPENRFLEQKALHLHVPEGATPKDGPSAGITMVTALLSLAMGRPPSSDLAMTGELTLTGRVLPIGGVKEKLIAARRAGVRNVVFPKANERDVAELPENLRAGLHVHYAQHYDDVYRVAFESDADADVQQPSVQ